MIKEDNEILIKHKKSLEEYQTLHGVDKDLIPIIDTLSRLIAHFETIEKAEVPKKWDYSNNYSPEDFAYGAGYNACHDLFMPAYEKLMIENSALKQQVVELSKIIKENHIIDMDEAEYIAKVERYTELESKYYDLEAEVKRLREALEKIRDTDIVGDKLCRKIAWKALIQHQKERGNERLA